MRLSSRSVPGATLVILLCVAAAAAVADAQASAKKTRPRIGIVGGGLAGLTAAYKLGDRKGLDVTLFEAEAGRLGGRAFSGKFANGQIFERGGELVDSTHNNIISLATSFNISLRLVKVNQALTNTAAATLTSSSTQAINDVLNLVRNNPDLPSYYRVVDYSVSPPGVKVVSDAEVFDYWTRINPSTGLSLKQVVESDAVGTWPPSFKDLGKATWPINYKDLARAKQLDAMTLAEYIDSLTAPLCKPGCTTGRQTPMAQILRNAYRGEYGAEPEVQSPFNLIWLLGYGPSDRFEIFGESDELFAINGGASALVDALSAALQQQQVTVNKGYRVTSVVRQNDGTYTLSGVKAAGGTFIGVFDRIVLANPFSTMRRTTDSNGAPSTIFGNEYMDVSQAGLSDRKLYAIQRLPMGQNAKLMVQTPAPFWRTQSARADNGELYGTTDPTTSTASEGSFQNTWETSRGQVTATTPTGVLTNWQSARVLLSNGGQWRDDGSVVPNGMVSNLLTKLGDIITVPSSYNANQLPAVYHYWPGNRYTRGAYSFWARGQYAAGTGTLPSYQATTTTPLTAPQVYQAEPLTSVVPFAGYEAVAEPFGAADPNCHFAGEHTSFGAQGFLEGAVISGLRAAQEIIDAVRADKATEGGQSSLVLIPAVAAVAVLVAVAALGAIGAYVIKRRRQVAAAPSLPVGANLPNVSVLDGEETGGAAVIELHSIAARAAAGAGVGAGVGVEGGAVAAAERSVTAEVSTAEGEEREARVLVSNLALVHSSYAALDAASAPPAIPAAAAAAPVGVEAV